MNKDVQTAVTDIINLVEKILPLSAQRLNGSAQEIVNRSTLQVGVLGELGIEYNSKGIIKADTSNLSLEENSINPGTFLTQELAEKEMLPLLQKQLLKVIREYDSDPVLNFKFQIGITLYLSVSDTVKRNVEYLVLDYVSESKKEKLLKSIDKYIEDKLFTGKYPTKELDTTFLSKHLVDKKLYSSIDADRVIKIIERIFELNKNNPDVLTQHRNSIVYSLKQWADRDFLFPYCEKMEEKETLFFSLKKKITLLGLIPGIQISPEDKPLLPLLVYTAILILKYEPNYARSKGIEYLTYAEGLGYSKAKEIQKTGSGQFVKEEIIVKEKGIECMANDVFAVFTIKIKEEAEENYRKALCFISALLQKGFPKSYQIKFSSKVKNQIPVKRIGKTKTLQFFANALQYPALWGDLESYARLTIHEFEWYADADAEYCAMPGTYAVFGLALQDQKYFPLVEYYLSRVDSEHQSVQYYLIQPLIDKWGVNTSTIPLLINCFTANEDGKPLKLADEFEKEENLKLFTDITQNIKKYEFSHIVYFIWGTFPDLEKRMKKADERVKPVLTEFLKKMK